MCVCVSIMARVVRKQNCSTSISLLFFSLCVTNVAASSKNSKSSESVPRDSPPAAYHELRILPTALGPRPVSEFVQNGSRIVAAHARIVHRDSTFSPVRRRNATRVERMRAAVARDLARVSSIQKRINQAAQASRQKLQQSSTTTSSQRSFESPVSSGLAFGTGEYFAILGIGTPKRPAYLVVDTGSDITWLQCAPCTNCYKQRNTLFDPASSSTFKPLRCDAPLCLSLDVMGCQANTCLYQADYGDGSFTAGELVTDNVAMDGGTGSAEAVISDVPLGCGHDNEGMFGMAAGILGLGKGPLSFPNHADAAVFSYCLPDRESDPSHQSSLIFGDAAIPTNDHAPAASAVRFTPQVRNPRVATYYYVQVTGISVGGNLLSAIPASAFQLDFHGNGGTILDSGTTVTRLQTAAYTAIRDAFRDATKHLRSATTDLEIFDTCYDLTGMETISVPTVTFHFQGGYDMRLPPSNYIVPVNNNNTYCFAFAGTAGPSVIGNVQQQGFRVVYDNAHGQVGFYPGQC